MDANTPLKQLLSVLSERDIGLGHDDLAWLFDSPQTKDAMVSWVHEYLTPTTLLTPEELDIHAYISQTNYQPSTISKENGLPRPMQEHDFESVIDSLEASTAAIEKQTAILEAQRDALRQLQILNRQPVSTTSGSDEKRSVQARSKAQLDLETGELSDTIQQRLGLAQRQAESNLTSLKSSAQRQLDKDDRLLDGLQKVMNKLTPLDPSATRLPDFDTLAHALTKLESRIVKDRTNSIYLNSLKELESGITHMTHQDNEQAAQEAFELTEELESLIAEVDSVLGMAVDKQYRAPIMKAIAESDKQAQVQQQKWLDYVKTTLVELAQRTEALATSTQDAQSYTKSLTQISAALTAILPPPTQPTPKLNRAQSTKHITPLLAPNLLPRQNPTTKNPALELLGYHSIRLPSHSANPNTLTSTLTTTIQSRHARLTSLSSSTQSTITAQIADAINTADADLQNLMGVLFAYSPFATVKLVNEGVKERLERLDGEIASIGEGIRGLDLGVLEGRERRRLELALGGEGDGEV